MKNLNRRDMLAGIGVAYLLGIGLTGSEVQAEPSLGENDPWKYAKIDPAKAAQFAYDIFPDGACMYATVRALLTTVADTQKSTDPHSASTMLKFPFQMMKYGHGGVAMLGSTCGTFNGAAAVISLFVNDATRRDMMIQELASYYENTELPLYEPKDDKFPTMEKVVSESVLCHISCTRWKTAADVPMLSPKRAERCRRLSADIVAKTAELLNRDDTDKKCTFAVLPQPTVSCVECHGPGGTTSDTIVRMNCASCHEHDQKHIDKYPMKRPH